MISIEFSSKKVSGSIICDDLIAERILLNIRDAHERTLDGVSWVDRGKDKLKVTTKNLNPNDIQP
jgi:hypothetical protein